MSMQVDLMDRKFYSVYLNAHPGIQEALTTGMIEGVPFRLVDGEINEGDTYIAERNTGLKLLTCRSVHRDGSLVGGWIHPVEQEYSYDIGECMKVELLLD